MAHELTIDKMTVHRILTNPLGMRREAARFVPKELIVLQKEHWKKVVEDMISGGSPTVFT